MSPMVPRRLTTRVASARMASASRRSDSTPTARRSRSLSRSSAAMSSNPATIDLADLEGQRRTQALTNCARSPRCVAPSSSSSSLLTTIASGSAAPGGGGVHRNGITRHRCCRPAAPRRRRRRCCCIRLTAPRSSLAGSKFLPLRS